jgi:hypothetical protein
VPQGLLIEAAADVDTAMSISILSAIEEGGATAASAVIVTGISCAEGGTAGGCGSSR